MLSRVHSASLWGLEAFPVECEIDVGTGLPGFILIGLPDASAREARDRVWPALRNSGFKLPDRRVTVNLAPAERRKEGASADLAVALGVLVATHQAPGDKLGTPTTPPTAVIAELALDGSLRGVRGTLSLAEAAWRNGATALLCAADAAPEAALVSELEVFPVRTLAEAVAWLRGEVIARQAPAPPDALTDSNVDLADVRGQAVARRALEIAAAGAHHVLLIGPPGAGKSMLARRLPGLMPPLAADEALTVTRLHSAAGLRPPGAGLMRRRPFRAPHHTLSRAGLIGGGSPPRPGEVSLAHRGVLFLDELSEFQRSLLDALREPLEIGEVHIARASGTSCFPARTLLIGAKNPCACGFLGHPKRGCTCTPTSIAHHASRISGPVLDRIDLQLEVPALTSKELEDAHASESSADVRARVCAARTRQERRGGLNAELPAAQVRAICRLDARSRGLIRDAMDRGGVSARGVHRALRVARTIADLAGREHVDHQALAEAFQYRRYERHRYAIR